MTNAKLTLADVAAAAERFSNWGRWGDEDEIGTLNYTSPDDIVAASRLVMTGEVISLAIDLDRFGPQGASGGYPSARFNPIHVMLKTGTDAYAGVMDDKKVRASDDIVTMPLQCGTHWDALSHVFYNDSMWNGRDCRLVTSAGATQCGIEKTKQKMVGRGVLLDIPVMLGVDHLDDGFAITGALLDQACSHFSVDVGRGDHVIVRTGQMERCQAQGSWDGYAGGNAPGLAFDTLEWIYDKRIAAVATDTWGVEVRPNNSDEVVQPFHWIAIPMMGLSLGEIFQLAELSQACRTDSRYEFMFVAPALPFTGAVGAPANPVAIR